MLGGDKDTMAAIVKHLWQQVQASDETKRLLFDSITTEQQKQLGLTAVKRFTKNALKTMIDEIDAKVEEQGEELPIIHELLEQILGMGSSSSVTDEVHLPFPPVAAATNMVEDSAYVPSRFDNEVPASRADDAEASSSRPRVMPTTNRPKPAIPASSEPAQNSLLEAIAKTAKALPVVTVEALKMIDMCERLQHYVNLCNSQCYDACQKHELQDRLREREFTEEEGRLRNMAYNTRVNLVICQEDRLEDEE